MTTNSGAANGGIASAPFRASLKAFINSDLLAGREPVDIGDDDPLLDRGILSSLSVLIVSRFIEDETGVRVPDRELRLENFRSIASIEQLVQRLSAR